MKIASLTRNWQVYDIRWADAMIPGIPFPVKKVSYEIKVETFVPTSLLTDVKRFDTLSWWILTYNEELRHLALASTYKNSPHWQTIKSIYESLWEDIQDTWIAWLDKIIETPANFDHWKFYVKEHGASASPWGCKWSEILESERALKTTMVSCDTYLKQFREDFRKLCNRGGMSMFRADETYAAMRARPADYAVIGRSDYGMIVRAEKWRDRKAGGIRGPSQMTWRIYKKPEHKIADAIIERTCKKITNVDDFRSLDLLGPQCYLDFINEEQMYVYDTKTGEKQVGLCFSDMPLGFDGSHHAFPADYAPELYSGIGPTSPANKLYNSIVTKAAQEDSDFKPKRIYSFSDNIAFDVPLPESYHVHLDEAQEFCGLNFKLKHFSPVSLVTDNPKQRILFNGKSQKQVQTFQYFMRPLLTLVMNDIFETGACKRFLEYVVGRQDLNKSILEDADSYRQDHLKEIVYSKDREVHQSVADQFPTTVEMMFKFFRVQDRDPEYASDLRVSNE